MPKEFYGKKVTSRYGIDTVTIKGKTKYMVCDNKRGLCSEKAYNTELEARKFISKQQ